MTDALIEAGKMLLRRFERCAKAHGNGDDVIADSTAEFRAALAAAQAGATTEDLRKLDYRIIHVNGFATGIEAAAKRMKAMLLDWRRHGSINFTMAAIAELETSIRALRPAETAESEVMQHHEGHQWDANSDSLDKTPPLSASEPAGARTWRTLVEEDARNVEPAGPSEGQFRIILERREDGGLRVCSDDVPGLILSGPDPAKVMSDVWPALLALLRRGNDGSDQT